MSQKFSEVLAMVMAGGRGERLYPLTLERTKPSVPFGGKYRIIDFALSNLINSGIYSIYVLVQYKSQSLIEHIRTTWRREGVLTKHFITVVPPQMRRTKEWYRGTADSIYQNINLVYDFKPRLVAIFGGDHVYRMNIKDMVDFHLRKKAKLTISVIPVKSNESGQLGIVDMGENFKIKSFKEKPSLSKNKTVYASMGNYIFDTDFLIKILEDDAKREGSHDFGRDIIARLVAKTSDIYAYDFSGNSIPFLKKHEAQFYWKDVGTIASYFEANMDLLGSKPKLDLDNQSWPIYASNLNSPPAYTIGSSIENSLICEGTKVFNAKITDSILGRGILVGDGCVIENSIILDFCQVAKNCHIKNSIIDRFNCIAESTQIGYNRESDSRNYYLDKSGVVVVKRSPRRAFYF